LNKVADQNQPTDAIENQQPYGAKLRVYGGSAALCVEATLTKAAFPTLTFEAAQKKLGALADWSAKVAVQLTSREMPEAVNVLLGRTSTAVFEHHGPAKNKSLTMRRTDNAILVIISGPGASYTIPITAGDVFHLTTLALNRLVEANPVLGVTGILAALRSIPAPSTY